MGTGHSARRMSFDASGEVNFDHFQILRAIGKGTFGKVCIVQKKDMKKMFAMKYMNKAVCASQSAINNVIRELNMLTRLDHPFLVNLWYAFQDEEDMFMVVDLLLGGDLRYHMTQDVKFTEECLKLYFAELGLAIDYLHSQHIVHRDIKPDNILLDEQGHCHVTDFNIATHLGEDELATSMSGTRPYMAPEVFGTALGERRGYSYPIDWWSLGVTIFEVFKKRRPYQIHGNTTNHEIWAMMMAAREESFAIHQGSDELKNLLKLLLEFEPNDRLCSLESLKKHKFMAGIDFDQVHSLSITPPFIPSKEHLNCDPTYELEEMIIETKPLHKKKKRLAKQNSRQSTEGESEMDDLTKMFKYYNKDDDRSQKEKHKRSSPSIVKAKIEEKRDSHCVDPELNIMDVGMCLQEGPTVTAPKCVSTSLLPVCAIPSTTTDPVRKSSAVSSIRQDDKTSVSDQKMKPADQSLTSALFSNYEDEIKNTSGSGSVYHACEDVVGNCMQITRNINASSPSRPDT